jgi:PAS domain S-box-containing protein
MSSIQAAAKLETAKMGCGSADSAHAREAIFTRGGALISTLEHFARIQRIASLGSAEVDFRTGIWRWSEEAYRLHGFEPGEFTPSTESILTLVHAQDRKLYRDSLASAMRGGPLDPIEYRIVRPDGQIRTLRRECEYLRNDENEITGLFVVKRDVTELRAAERRHDELQQQLVHGQRLEALGTLAGGIAHDLNNTLVPILGLSEAVAQSLPAGDPNRELLAVVQEAGRRARDLVRQILAFSRHDSPARAIVDLGRLVKDSMCLLRASLPPTIQLVERIEQVPLLLGDSAQLHQVILNLVSNAADAIGTSKGAVVIEVATLPPDAKAIPQIRIMVSDTGCGMDSTTKARVFEPFFTTKDVGRGTGLGLSVVHGIVASHGGRITVESWPGIGTRFDVVLPGLPQQDTVTSGENANG